jgi:hypothetical protein
MLAQTITMCRRLILIMLGAFAVALLVSFLVASFKSSIGRCSSSLDSPLFVPEDATDIRYIVRGAFGPNTACEFSTSKESFLIWVKHWSDMPISGPSFGPTEIIRYDHDINRWEHREIKNAIRFDWNEEDRGIHLVFDSDTGRAYYHLHTR